MGLVLVVILMVLNLALGYALAVFLGHDHLTLHAELPPVVPFESRPLEPAEPPAAEPMAPDSMPVAAPQNEQQGGADFEATVDPKAAEDFAALAAAADNG
ncbi:MAG: hypothetical protein K1X74_07615 [Pirellulales bacterium]|nr:hypothetical protein [Pirellulales bacterium]